MNFYTVAITNKADNTLIHKANYLTQTMDGAIDQALDAIDAHDDNGIEYDIQAVATKNKNGDTYERTIQRLDITFEGQSRNNPYPSISWLLGSDWGCGGNVSAMSMEEYYRFAFERAKQQYL